MNILICTIVRNEMKFLDKWYTQIKEMVTSFKDDNFSLTVFENDSTDGSFQKIASYDWSFLANFSIITCKLNSPYYFGGKHPQRVANLAFCRNKAIYQFPFLNDVSHILFFETDVECSLDVKDKIIHHEKHYGKKMDVFCGKSVHPGTENIYDSWGTRKTPNQTDWKDADGQTAGFEPMWSVFNCFVIYNAEPIKKGITFGGFNERLGIPDCDTVVLCENFRKAGYDKIYWDTNLHVTHTVNEV